VSPAPVESTLVDPWLFGIASGLLAGLGIFAATNWLVLKGGEVPGQHLALLGQYFIGYRVTFVGSWIGLVYGFATGFGSGCFLAVTYNTLVRLRKPASSRTTAEAHS
jgi:hypothetical protein